MKSNVANILLENDILLESGTNELEVLVFRLGDFTLGINVAKVREVLPLPTINALPKAHSSVIGVFRLRDKVVPCVSLHKHLGAGTPAPDAQLNVILADFNQQQTAFVVDVVERIHRLSWERIMAMPSLMSLNDIPVTAVAKIDNRLVIMLDFELVAMQVGDKSIAAVAVENKHGFDRTQVRLLVADDSPTVRQAITATLTASDYTRLTVVENGHEAWTWLERKLAENPRETPVDVVISDVEMPLADGFFLTKRIKEHPRLKEVPVLLYSSIVTPDNFKKGQAVGADMQLAKPDMHRVVEVMDGFIAKRRMIESGASAPPVAIQAKPPAPVAASPPPPGPAAPVASIPAAPARVVVPAPASTPAASPPSAVPAAPAPPARDARMEDACAALMNTLRVELSDRVRAMNRMIENIEKGKDAANNANEFMRALHTVKSAASVVPVVEVIDVAHELETLLAPIREEPSKWPLDRLHQVMDWLTDVSETHLDLRAALALGDGLAAALKG